MSKTHYFFLVSCTRLERVTLWLKVKCSTNWANRTKIYWLPRGDSNHRNVRVKVWCLTTWLRGNKKMVEGHRFELWNPKEQIYSLPRLTTSLSLQQMVPTERLELPTYWLQVSCATNYAMSAKNGGRCRTRTYDPLLVRQML